MKFKITSLVVAFVLATRGSSLAQQIPTPFSQAVQGMKSATWEGRSKAFDEARALLDSGQLNPGDADRLRICIFQLLVKENSGGLKGDEPSPKQGYGEGYGEDKSEYYAGLIGFVADLHDERSIPALLGAASTGGIATKGTAQFGDKALDATLLQAKNLDSDLACGALSVIRQMLKLKTVSPESQIKIKSALREALVSPDYQVRERAMSPIEYLDNKDEFIPILQDIAEHDPYKSSYGQAEEDRYLVRHIAQLTLQKIIAAR